MPRLLLTFLMVLPLQLLAAKADSVGTTEHQWLYGVGYTNALDTYLSPLEYTGPSFGLLHRTERCARWGKGRVSVQGLYGGNLSVLSSPTEDADEWDGNFSAAFGWHYNWHPVPALRLAAGAMLEGALGFTYNLRNGNNPAQGRVGMQLLASGIAEYAFRIGRRNLSSRLQMDFPLAGAMFSPNYGQSYYEIFSLGHYDHNICFTHPFNAPSAHVLFTLQVPMGRRAVLSVGYDADIRQSHVNHLKRHHWSHRFVIGYVRRISIH